jgi:hypothetical protein
MNYFLCVPDRQRVILHEAIEGGSHLGHDEGEEEAIRSFSFFDFDHVTRLFKEASLELVAGEDVSFFLFGHFVEAVDLRRVRGGREKKGGEERRREEKEEKGGEGRIREDKGTGGEGEEGRNREEKEGKGKGGGSLRESLPWRQSHGQILRS